MTSLPGAFVGGIIVGLIQSLSNWAAGNENFAISIGGENKLIQEIVPGPADVVLLIVLLAVLLARPQGLLGTEA
jgi:branched-subunit amino acid ABC-type transport system permease component